MLTQISDTSKPVELHDTGFVPLNTPTAAKSNLHSTSSATSHTSRASSVSRESHSPRPGLATIARSDSPPLGSNDSTRVGFLSGVSSVSESDRGHMRGISETSVSSDGQRGGSEYATPMEFGHGANGTPVLRDLPSPAAHSIEEGDGRGARRNVVSPLTPPDGREAAGYMGSGSRNPGAASPGGGRRSNFAEGLDEVTKEDR